MKVIVAGVFIHLMFLISIFDIYFTTPIIHGMTPHVSDRPAPAKRLILIVADGLRAESLYGDNYSKLSQMDLISPHLSSVIKSHGSWGISHTRVPTESRPGHVALAGGIYEDPSAIAKGWKENPVEFDSVFNESRNTWAWGSPDIVPMFAKVPHVYAYSYSPEEEDFSGKQSTSLLDTWVFERVEKFFSEVETNENTKQLVHSDKIIFFLHLLGLDTAGHTHKPYSAEHISNIKVVDDGIRRIETLVQNFYNDNLTTFIFTADHGMTDWGSHGAGSKSETETPFITWGPGIKVSKEPIELNQADIAPLMSTLVGIPVPINSVGVLPSSCLNITEGDLASAIFANARQIYAQYDEKRRRTEKNSISFLYSPFPVLSVNQFEKLIIKIHYSINTGEFKQAIKSCQYLIDVATRGLDYYQNYYQRLLLTCITFSYIGWIILLLISLGENSSSSDSGPLTDDDKQLYKYSWFKHEKVAKIVNFTFSLMILTTSAALFVQSLPFMYHVYCIVSQIIWWIVIRKLKLWLPKVNKVLKSKKESVRVLLWIILYVTGVELLVMCFFDRKVLSVPLVIMSVWPYFLSDVKYYLKMSWTFTSLALTAFPFLPVIGSSFNYVYIGVTGILWILVNFIFTFLPLLFVQKTAVDKRRIFTTIIQNIFLLIAEYNLYVVDTSIKNKSGLSLENQCVSWILLGISLLFPLFGSQLIMDRLFNIVMCLLIPFILLSVSYEPLFFLTLFLNLLFWLMIENVKFNPCYQHISSLSFNRRINSSVLNTDREIINNQDFRRGYFFLLYVVLAFFGTGNMASINSFDPMWVRNFVTVFSPFTMAALILFKMLIPYVIVSCVFRAVTVCLQAPVRKLFFIMLIFCDIMGLHFLFLVKNYGSWLEIGSSISHFVIVQTMVLFVLLLYGVAVVFTQVTVGHKTEDVAQKHHVM